MSIDFHYGGLPPAMAREMERIGVQQPGAPSMPVLSLPEIPRQQSMQMPMLQNNAPAPQVQQLQGVRTLGSPQQYMPQARQGIDSSGYMPQAGQGVNPANYMPQPMSPTNNMLQQYMPKKTSPYQNANPHMPEARNGGTSMMPDMNTWMSERNQINRTNINIIDSQKAARQQMNMGRQDVGTQGADMSDMKVSKGLGALSAKYESNGNPGTVAHTKGDIGGASYGSYQLSTTSGNAAKFAAGYGGSLKGKKPGTAAFDAAWRAEAKKNPKGFQAAQHKYIENTHYKPTVVNIKKKTGFDVSKYPKAVQDAVWSMGVQHGAGGAASIFRNSGVKNGMSAEQVLRKVYGERMKTHIYFKSSPKNIQNSVRNRFQGELNDALKML